MLACLPVVPAAHAVVRHAPTAQAASLPAGPHMRCCVPLPTVGASACPGAPGHLPLPSHRALAAPPPSPPSSSSPTPSWWAACGGRWSWCSTRPATTACTTRATTAAGAHAATPLHRPLCHAAALPPRGAAAAPGGQAGCLSATWLGRPQGAPPPLPAGTLRAC